MIPTENKKLLNPEFAHIARQYEIMKSGLTVAKEKPVFTDLPIHSISSIDLTAVTASI